MSPEARQRRLESLVRKARGRWAQITSQLDSRRGLPPAPGDLFVLAATADLPVEWAILDRRTPSGELLAVPADSHPFAGSADVAAKPDGSLILRCRFGVWLDPAAFASDRRTGVVAGDVVASALHRWRQLEQGETDASPLAEEVDVDPEYRDWIRDVPERARSLAWRVGRGSESGSSLARWTSVLAAACSVLALGLSLWVVRLRREVERLSPSAELLAASEEVALGVAKRGVETIVLPPGEGRVELHLAVEPTLGSREGFVEILDHAGRLVARSQRQRLPASGKFGVALQRRLPDGLYLIRLLPGAGSGAPPLATVKVQVETEK